MNQEASILSALKKASGVDSPNLEFTDNLEFGDFSSNIAMSIFANQGIKSTIHDSQFKSPHKLAENIVNKLKSDKELSKIVDRIETAGPGFINFWLKKDVLVDNLIQIGKEKEDYGTSTLNKGRKIILEFTDPNPFKEFHIGHLYTNTVGESLSRLLEATGATIKRANYQGDVGLHVAKAVWGMKQKMLEDKLSLPALSKKGLKERVKFMGESYALGARVYEEDETGKSEINLLNKKIFEGDSETAEIYKKGRGWSLEYFESIYKRIGTKFDYYYFESEVGVIGEKIVKENLKKGIFKESEGAIIFPGSEYGLHDRVFINSMGLPTYEAKELGLAPTKFKDFAYDQSIIITANEIKEYFRVLIKAMSFVYPELSEKTLHIGHGMVKLPEGKMSSRTGEIITAESFLDDVKGIAAKINEESAEVVSMGAVKYAFLKVGIPHDIVYDINESLSLEGNSGPYLQYTVARCNGVIEKAPTFKGSPLKGEYSNYNDEELVVLRSLSRFTGIIATAAKSYSPNLLCSYLYDLAQKYNGFYNAHKIIGGENEEFKLELTKGVGIVLKNGLKLLGIQAPERM